SEADAPDVRTRIGEAAGQPLPGLAAVRRAVDARAGPAVAAEVGLPLGVPPHREDAVRIVRVDMDVRCAGRVVVALEDALPGLAAVRRQVDAALAARREQRS